MEVSALLSVLGTEFYTGVPDSQLRPLCDYLYREFGVSDKHIIAANEGNCAAIAAGYHLATGKIPAVYMQNSGIGNIVNPAVSLLHQKVYAIPCVFLIGWRGEPGVHDEPQHLFQGEITLALLRDLDIPYHTVTKETELAELSSQMELFRPLLNAGQSVAFLFKKGALYTGEKVKYENPHSLNRERVIAKIAEVAGEDVIVCTTGKASRELFEIRENAEQPHRYDFLTVGSMGHSSSIALGLALQKPEMKVWCMDGDGAALMHMGAMAVVGSQKPPNLVHVVLNNGAHETVGGMPTVAENLNLAAVASAYGYPETESIHTEGALDAALEKAKQSGVLCFIEVKTALGSRADLGRPTTTPLQNKQSFMERLKEG